MTGNPPAPQEWTAETLRAIPAWTLVRAYHAVGRELFRLFADVDLTPVQFGVLAQLTATPEVTSSQLARAVLIRPQSMAEVVTTLVDRGLLERRGPGGRGRPVPLTVTAAGTRVLDRAGRALQGLNSAAGLGLDDGDLVLLNDLLQRVLRHLER